MAGVQMAPLAFRLMIIQPAGRTAFRARPADHIVVSQMNVDLTHLQLQLHGVHVPGSLDSENAPIEFVILHPRHCRMRPAGIIDPPRILNSPPRSSGFAVVNPVLLLH